MAPVQAHAVVQHLSPLGLVLVAGIGEPAVGLQEDGGAEVLFAVPPVRGAGCRAAGAEDAFVEAVELLAFCGRLTVFEALHVNRVSGDWGWEEGWSIRVRESWGEVGRRGGVLE